MYYYNRFSHEAGLASNRSSTVSENIRKFESLVHKPLVEQRCDQEKPIGRDRLGKTSVLEKVVQIEGPKNQFGPRIRQRIEQYEELRHPAEEPYHDLYYDTGTPSDKAKQIKRDVARIRRKANRQPSVRDSIRKFENLSRGYRDDEDDSDEYHEDIENTPPPIPVVGICYRRQAVEPKPVARVDDGSEKSKVHVNQFETTVKERIRNFEQLRWRPVFARNESLQRRDSVLADSNRTPEGRRQERVDSVDDLNTDKAAVTEENTVATGEERPTTDSLADKKESSRKNKGHDPTKIQIPKIHINFESVEKLEIRKLRANAKYHISRTNNLRAKTKCSVKEYILRYESLNYQSGVSLNIDSTRF